MDEKIAWAGTLSGIIGFMLIFVAYYLLWISPDAGMKEIIMRTRIAIVLNLTGGIMVVYYLYRK